MVAVRKKEIRTRKVSYKISSSKPESTLRGYEVTPRSQSREMHQEDHYFGSQSSIHPAEPSELEDMGLESQRGQAEKSSTYSFPLPAGTDRGQSSWLSQSTLASTTPELSKSQQLTREMNDMYY